MVWAKGLGCREALASALQATAHVDAILGFSLHPEKCQFFAKQSQKKVLHDLMRERGFDWDVVCAFKLLGLSYNLTKRKFTPVDDKVRALVLRRLDKVQLPKVPCRAKTKSIFSVELVCICWGVAFSIQDHTGQVATGH